MTARLDWYGCATFRLTVGSLVLFLDAYIDRVPGAAGAAVSTVMLGPTRSRKYDSRPDAAYRPVPVVMWKSIRSVSANSRDSYSLISERTVALRDGQTLRLETGVGVIPVDTTNDAEGAIYTMTQTSPEFRESDLPLEEIARLFGLPASDVLRAGYVTTGW